VSCEVFQDFERLAPLREAWDDAVLRTGGSVYMTYDWVRLWWQFYGGTAQLRVFVFSAGGLVVAVLPLYIDTLGWGPARLRVARLVGSNIPPKVFDPPVPANMAGDLFAAVLGRLFTRERCDVLSLGPVSERHLPLSALRIACERQPGLVGRIDALDGVHSVFRLPADMEAYYGALSKKESKNRKYYVRLLKKECDAGVDVVTDSLAVIREFELFAEQHRQQWHAEGKSGHFGAWPRALDFNRALVEAQARLGRVRFIRILANDRVIAYQYIFAFGDRYYWELPSRAVEPKWERFSLGPTGIVTMIDEGIAERMAEVEGGLGHYDYKVRLGAKEYPARTYRIVTGGLSPRMRFGAFSAIATVVRLAYHKLWYRRIAPRLPPAFWRPQWRLWLRLDF
jgi:CelD/BcsL family acetyltransferase involved in cellulose biosynthesis